MKKILFILLLLFTFTLVSTKTFAYSYDIGNNSPNVYAFTDEFTYDSGTGDKQYWIKTSGLAVSSFTIVFKEDTPELGHGYDFIMTYGEDYFDDLESTTMWTAEQYYWQYLNNSLVPVKYLDLSNTMYYVHDDRTIINYILGVNINGMTTGLQTFIETYAYIIYDNPENIINNTIGYYSQIYGSDTYDEGYELGLTEGTASQSVALATYYYDNGFSDARELYGDYVGTEWLTFDDGYDIGYSYGTNATVNQSQINFYDDFEKWIVPAILLVILLGGFTTIYVHKRRGE
jgi:hypothetical protein